MSATDETKRVRLCLCGVNCWRVNGEAACSMISSMDCDHPAGCKCPAPPLEKVPCGKDTIALCLAATKVRDGRWWHGAATHVFADLLTELNSLGFVLARVKR